MEIQNNSNRKVSNVSLLLALVFFITIFLPVNLGMDGMNGGFALSVLFGFLFVTALIVAFIYRKLATQFDTIISGQNVLVHWKYTDDEWQKFTQLDFEADKQIKKSMFYIIAGFAIFFGILFPILDPDNGFVVTYVMLALIVVIAIVAYISVRQQHNRNTKNKGEAIISMKGILINKQLHSWSILGAKLENVTIKEEQVPIMEFTYSAITNRGRSEYSVRVPIPEGEMATAREIINRI
jgi:Ca2+/Na+ antiporter